jgi:predicted acyltransferase
MKATRGPDTTPSARLSSVDALRGLCVAAMLIVNDAGDWSHVYPWLTHAEWHGCKPADFIFPFFLLIVGVSISLSLGPRIEAGADPAQLTHAVLRRGLRIILLGLALHAAASLLIDGRAFRVMGVLQRIGICFAGAGLIAIHVGSARAQWILFAAILIGYWLLLELAGPLTPGENLADRIDTALLGRHAYVYDAATGRAHDPEGILSTVPALATVILGLRGGAWLRAGETRSLLLTGAAAVLLGGVWSTVLPFNKQLWAPSYVLWTGGFGLLAIAAAHELVDVRGWPAIGRSLGVNAIAAYAGAWLAICLLEGSGAMRSLYDFAFAGALTRYFGPEAASLAFALVFTGLWWWLIAVCTRRGLRITI